MRAIPRPVLVAGAVFFSTVGVWALAYAFGADQQESAVDPSWPLALALFVGTVLLFPVGLALLSSAVLSVDLPFDVAIAVAAAANGAFYAGVYVVARRAVRGLLAVRARARSA